MNANLNGTVDAAEEDAAKAADAWTELAKDMAERRVESMARRRPGGRGGDNDHR
jgi:hypothetical protein